MQKVNLVYLFDGQNDYFASVARALKEIGIEVEVCRIPYLWSFSLEYVNSLKAQLKKLSQERFLIFSPDSTELFLQEADFNLLFFGYRSWFDNKKMRVIPHLWTPVGLAEKVAHLKWTEKPPLQIGFMGRSFTDSKLPNFLSKMPIQLKQWLLKGSYIRYPRVIALMNDLGLSIKSINAFSRIETIKMLEAIKQKYKNVDVNVVGKGAFSGSAQDMNQYEHHLEQSTYVLCPRGTENYSFRMYEALARGKIPVIIDTDIALPREIPWDDLSLMVPYESLDKLYEVILSDYESRSSAEFVARQNIALSLMTELRSGRWIKKLAIELAQVAARQ